jgi:MFS family permease
MQNQHRSTDRWLIQALLMVFQISLGLNFMAPTALFTLIMGEFDISRGFVSLLISVVSIVFALFLLPGGLLVAKIGSKKAMSMSGVLMAAGLLVPLTDSFLILVILRFIFGIGAAISIPTTSAIIMEWFPPSERPLFNGINESGRAIGVAVGVFVAVPLTNVVGWQMVFFFYAMIPMVATVLWLIGGRASDHVQEAGTGSRFRDNIPLILNRNTLLIAVCCLGPFALFIGYSSWLPTYYNEIQGMTTEKAGSIVAVMPLATAAATPFSGILLSKLGRRKPVLLFAGLVFPLFALGSFLMSGTILPIICVIALGILFAMFIVTVFTIPMELPGVTANKVGIVTAAALTIGNGVAVLSPIFIGFLTDFMGSYLPAMSIIAILPLTLLIAARFLPETGPKAVLRTRQ